MPIIRVHVHVENSISQMNQLDFWLESSKLLLLFRFCVNIVIDIIETNFYY